MSHHADPAGLRIAVPLSKTEREWVRRVRAAAAQLGEAGIDAELGRNVIRRLIRTKHPHLKYSNAVLSAAIAVRKGTDGDHFPPPPHGWTPPLPRRPALTQQEIGDWLDAVKLAAGCMDCGYNDHPRALDFDHVIEPKRANVGALARSGASRDIVLAEMAKCEVVCANCHRIRTYERRQARMAEMLSEPDGVAASSQTEQPARSTDWHETAG